MRAQFQPVHIANNNITIGEKIMAFLSQLNQTMEELGNAASATRRG